MCVWHQVVLRFKGFFSGQSFMWDLQPDTLENVEHLKFFTLFLRLDCFHLHGPLAFLFVNTFCGQGEIDFTRGLSMNCEFVLR